MIQTFSEVQYGSLLEKFRPRIITTEEENERALASIEDLMTKESLSPEENTVYDLLITLISAFEAKTYPIRDSSPSETLLHLMEARGLKQKDLTGILGSKGVVSEVVNGKRSISKAQAKNLAVFFHVSPGIFL